VFFFCGLFGALANSLIVLSGNTFLTLFVIKFIVGFCLAGIYPIGMKIASDYYEGGLGKSLSYLVAALVLGTGLPHLLNSFYDGNGELWKLIILATSVIAFIGGLLMVLFVPDGPYRKPASSINPKVFIEVFRDREFRSVSFGYFGHMWELYAFWTFIPIVLVGHNSLYSSHSLNVPLWSFIIIAVGSIGCVIGGNLSLRFGSKQIAAIALFFSGFCCLISPFIIPLNQVVLIPFLIFWGMVVIADSPLFSTLVAQNAPIELKGTALTIVNCIGFSITIISIQLINELRMMTASNAIFIILALGPILGLIALSNKKPAINS